MRVKRFSCIKTTNFEAVFDFEYDLLRHHELASNMMLDRICYDCSRFFIWKKEMLFLLLAIIWYFV